MRCIFAEGSSACSYKILSQMHVSYCNGLFVSRMRKYPKRRLSSSGKSACRSAMQYISTADSAAADSALYRNAVFSCRKNGKAASQKNVVLDVRTCSVFNILRTQELHRLSFTDKRFSIIFINVNVENVCAPVQTFFILRTCPHRKFRTYFR